MKSAWNLKTSERATIETVVLQIGRVTFGSELRGEKWIDPKPLFTTPAIVCGYNLRSYVGRR
jgi:hypothetical protein